MACIFILPLPTKVYARIEPSRTTQRCPSGSTKAERILANSCTRVKKSLKILGALLVIGLRRPTRNQLFYIWHEDGAFCNACWLDIPSTNNVSQARVRKGCITLVLVYA